MHKITFFPLGNADTCLIELAGGSMMLFDYANVRDSENSGDKRIDLPAEVRKRLIAKKKESFDVVALTHADDDHIHGASDFFYLDHAAKYQSEDRIRIDELWVPAAMILEEGAENETRILRTEARYRLRNGKGIRVFSRPERLKEWLEKENIKLEDRIHLISDAGQLVPGLTKETHGVEFFVHSPFARHSDSNYEDRNECALIFHLTFVVEDVSTRVFLIGDTTYEILKEIIQITKNMNRLERLLWDVYDIPHHCSYKTLAEDKGSDKTKPDEDVEWLLSQGTKKCMLVSCSDPIPSEDTLQPPHFQAANLYREVAGDKNGEFLVTMEFPKQEKPEPIEITIGQSGTQVVKRILGPTIIASQRSAPRAG